MNKRTPNRLTRRAAAFAASTLVTFTGLQLIANYALPEPQRPVSAAQPQALQLAAAQPVSTGAP